MIAALGFAALLNIAPAVEVEAWVRSATVAVYPPTATDESALILALSDHEPPFHLREAIVRRIACTGHDARLALVYLLRGMSHEGMRVGVERWRQEVFCPQRKNAP